jgi:hypothetical protein
MDAISYIREDNKWANELLELVMQDVTQEQLEWIPPGIANPITATYTHAVVSEDAVIHQILKQEPSMFESSWKDKTGISEPQYRSEFEWGRRLQVDLPLAKQYAQAVYQAADDYLESLSNQDLDQEVDLTEAGFGVKSVGWILSSLLLSHTNNLAGEISVLKGLQGAKGYPW